MNNESFAEKWYKKPANQFLFGLIIFYLGFILTILLFNQTCTNENVVTWQCKIINNKPHIIGYGSFVFLLIYFLLFKKRIIERILKTNSKSRIAIFLPISCKEGYQNDDLKLMAEGFGSGTSDFFFNTNSELSESFELVFIDSNTEKKALEKLDQELKLGTKYFISTLSSFSLELSKHFNSIETDAILINTVSGSVKIPEVQNKIYNFYPNSKMEIDAIIETINTNDNSKPYIYNYNYTFTKECKSYFIEQWNLNKDKKLHLTDANNSYQFMDKTNFDLTHPAFINDKVKEADCIIILGYGASFFDLINKLKTLQTELENKFIYTISTFRYRKWIKEEADSINGLNIFTVRPKMKSDTFKIETDIVKYFSEQSLDRLLRTIEEINKNDINFDAAWKNTCPRRLDLDTNQNLKVETIQIV